MRIKTKLLLFAVSLTATAQFISCKKDSTNLNTSIASQNVNNAVTDSVTDSSLNRGLVAWYTFNGDVLDHSGNHNDVIFNSAFITSGKSGLPKTAYRFDGSNSYMQVADSKSINPLKISLYALIKPTGFYQGTCHNNYVICKETTDYDQGRYILGFGDQAYYNYAGCSEPVATKYESFLAAYGDGGSTAGGVTNTKDYVRLNQWYSVVYTFDGVYSKLYVNGVLKETVTQQATTFTASTTPLFIGKTPNDSYPYFFKGYIDEIRIYKRAINASEVKYLYNKN